MLKNYRIDVTYNHLPEGGRKAAGFRHGDERCCGFSRLEAMPRL